MRELDQLIRWPACEIVRLRGFFWRLGVLLCESYAHYRISCICTLIRFFGLLSRLLSMFRKLGTSSCGLQPNFLHVRCTSVAAAGMYLNFGSKMFFIKFPQG